MNINGKQIIAARALLGWSQQELADRAGTGISTVVGFEKGGRDTRTENKEAIIDTLELSGIDFTGGGVRPKSSNILIFEGPDCYLRVLDDIFYAFKDKKGEALFSCVKEAITPGIALQKELILRREGITFRSLVEEGDTYLPYPLDEYRYIPKEYFVNNTQAIYSNRVAILMNGNEKALVLENDIYAEVQRNLFNLIWATHKQPRTSTAEPIKW